MTLQQSTFSFIKDLISNNNREWFQENKDHYDLALKNFRSFVTSLEEEMAKYDVLDKTKVYRVYRDIRFSKDKTPYKDHFGANIRRQGKERRGGYFLGIYADHVLIGGGFWKPNSQDLGYIRAGIASHADDLRSALEDKIFLKSFGSLRGEEVKTAPKGYSKNHEEIDLLRKKQFIVMKQFSIAEATKPNFAKKLSSEYEIMLPFFAAITDMLLYDTNGVARD